MTIRVYLPATLPLLREWHDRQEIPPGPAHAVTPELREWYISATEEELEAAAADAAAASSLLLLGDDPRAPRRRVVVAADAERIERPAPGDPTAKSTARTTEALPWKAVAAALVDEVEAEDVVNEVLAGEEPDDELSDYPLAWYATQEIGHLLDRSVR